MNQNDRAILVDAFLMKALKLMRSKGEAYSGVDDVNANFKHAGKSLGLTKYQTWGIYVKKHIDCIFNAIKDNPDQPVDATESLEGRITDLLNYALILYTLLYEDQLVDTDLDFDNDQYVQLGEMLPPEVYSSLSGLTPESHPVNPNIKMEVEKHGK